MVDVDPFPSSQAAVLPWIDTEAGRPGSRSKKRKRHAMRTKQGGRGPDPVSKKRKPATVGTPALAQVTADQGPPPGAGAADRISLIPDTILGEIVSLLPSKEGARTQFLASRWRHIWSSTPLNLDCSGLADPRAVSLILTSHRAPVRRLCIPAGHGYTEATVEAWLQYTALDRLEELEFCYLRDYGPPSDYWWWKTPFLPLPPASIFRFAATLRLAKCRLSDSTVQGLHFPQLKHLVLHWMETFGSVDMLHPNFSDKMKPTDASVSRPKNFWRRNYRNLIGCLDIRLKIVVIENFKGSLSKVNFATFFVQNARELELMTIQVESIDDEFIARQQRLLLLEKKASRVLLLPGIDSVPLLKLLALEESEGGSVQMIIQTSKLDAVRLLAISTVSMRIGLNQIFDIQIDKVNKPGLPLAAGEFSVKTAVFLVLIFLIMSFSIGIHSGSAPLMCALIVSFILGSAYSIEAPLLRWKRHAFLAASCILFVRAILVQLAFFAHMQHHVLMRPLAPTKSLVFATFFMCCFSAVIALFKDIPDIDGDRDFGIQSLSVKLGPHRVSGHGLLAFTLWQRARHFEVENQARVTSFYMFIWKLFYAEYFLIPFVQ
ncbi:hypothetical protein ACQ4PT_021025 [Festuca glaucescens]